VKALGSEAGEAEYATLKASCEPGQCLEVSLISLVAKKLGLGLVKHDVNSSATVSLGALDAKTALHFTWRPEHYDAVAFILPNGSEAMLVDSSPTGEYAEAVGQLMKSVRMLYQLEANKAATSADSKNMGNGTKVLGSGQGEKPAKPGRDKRHTSTGRKVHLGVASEQASSPPKRAMCRFIQDGKPCKYGGSCKFSHDSQSPSDSVAARLEKLEQQLQLDPRARAETIQKSVQKRIKGVCRVHAAGGRCSYGDNCKFEHAAGMRVEPVTVTDPRPQSSGRGERKSTNQRDKPPAQAQSVAVCREYAEGWRCPRGLKCRFDHPVDDGAQARKWEEPVVPTSVSVCPEFAGGFRCPRGANCRFNHPVDEEEQSPRQKPKRQRHGTPQAHPPREEHPQERQALPLMPPSPPRWMPSGPQLQRAQPQGAWLRGEPVFATQPYPPRQYAPPQLAPHQVQSFAPQWPGSQPGFVWWGAGSPTQQYL
jgi:hypothetical protein